MQAVLSTSLPSSSSSSNGARLVAADGRELSFRGATVHVRAQGGLAVVVLTQRFANPYAEPLSVRYTMPLPADAAVRGYSFLIGSRLVRGQVDRKKAARERFERAVAAGHTAGILEQERSSLFTQELGNLPPGEELVAMIEVDQRLFWLDDGAWEWRFPTVVAPRYLGPAGRVADAAAVSVDVADGPLAPRVSLVLHVLDEVLGAPSSPTHGLEIGKGEGVEIQLAEASRLDRDIAVRWPVAQPRVGVALQAARPEAGQAHDKSAYGLMTVVPPAVRSRGRAVARDLILLVDASGSMYGAPIGQARRLMKTLIESLEEGDSLEMISFGDRPHRWKRGSTRATAAGKKEALAWVERLQAEGGTEMRSGILEALAPLRPDAQRQVVLITDGLIGSESEIVATLHEKLPPRCRLHTVGVGSGINRSLTGPAARAGRGVEVLLDIDGDAAEATRRLLARTCAPLVTELTLDGDALAAHAPARLPDLFAGAPVLLSLQLRPEGGKVRLRGETADGPWSAEATAPALAPGEGSPSLAALFGRESVEDLEALWAVGRDQGKIDQQIERLGVDFQIATRLTSWVAVTEHRTVDPAAKARRENTPQALPHGMSAEGLGLRPAASPAATTGKAMMALFAAPEAPAQQAQESGALFSLKALVSLEEERVAEEKPFDPSLQTRAGRVMPGPAPVFAPSVRAPSAEIDDFSGPLGLADDLEAPLPFEDTDALSAMPSSGTSPVEDRPASPAALAPAPKKVELRTRLSKASADMPASPGSASADLFGAREHQAGAPLARLAPEKRRRGRIFLVLLALLALLAVVYWFFLRR